MIRKPVLNETVENKKLLSPKFCRILRRQKIYIEIEDVKIMDHTVEGSEKIDVSNSSVIVSYSDFYFKHNKQLPSMMIDLKKFVQTERNLLISNEIIYASAFVPLFQTNSVKILQRESCYNPWNFHNYIPIFSNLSLDCAIKSYYYLMRMSSGIQKKRTARDNLDEILLIRDEIETNSNQEANNLIETYYDRNVLLLDPLLLDINERRTQLKLSQSEHKKIVRVTIMYILAFFALALVTFFSLYLL